MQVLELGHGRKIHILESTFQQQDRSEGTRWEAGASPGPSTLGPSSHRGFPGTQGPQVG